MQVNSGINECLKLKTDLNANIVKCFPKNRNFITCGTYQLNENTKLRDGYLYNYFYNKELNTLQCLQKINTFGIFDLNFNQNNSILSTCHSNYSISLFSINENDNYLNLLQNFKPNLENNCDNNCDTMFTSLEFFDNTKFTCSDSNGEISIFRINNNSNIEILSKYKAHSYESWCSSFFDENTIYSGGDDHLFTIFDIRTNKVIYKNSKLHESGICCIVTSNFSKYLQSENYFLTGSYDENLTCWDNRMLNKEIYKITLNGGGVWDISIFENENGKINVACPIMYEGYTIMELNRKSGELEVKYRYLPKVESSEISLLCYGIDFINEKELITCSFYDKQLRLISLE
ncbi:hypothetical protein ABK040_002216 [Willaertia magna]